jgi:hypothetical protein
MMMRYVGGNGAVAQRLFFYYDPALKVQFQSKRSINRLIEANRIKLRFPHTLDN